MKSFIDIRIRTFFKIKNADADADFNFTADDPRMRMWRTSLNWIKYIYSTASPNSEYIVSVYKCTSPTWNQIRIMNCYRWILDFFGPSNSKNNRIKHIWVHLWTSVTCASHYSLAMKFSLRFHKSIFVFRNCFMNFCQIGDEIQPAFSYIYGVLIDQFTNLPSWNIQVIIVLIYHDNNWNSIQH